MSVYVLLYMLLVLVFVPVSLFGWYFLYQLVTQWVDCKFEYCVFQCPISSLIYDLLLFYRRIKWYHFLPEAGHPVTENLFRLLCSSPLWGLLLTTSLTLCELLVNCNDS